MPTLLLTNHPGARLPQRCSSGGDSEQRHSGSVTEHVHRLWEPFLLGLPRALQAEMPHSQLSPAPPRSRVTLRRETPQASQGHVFCAHLPDRVARTLPNVLSVEAEFRLLEVLRSTSLETVTFTLFGHKNFTGMIQ